mmetsp:Transcript_45312/g.112557  ORF Transcript_45312/g.112557 Transcript_45312/m.112557 type:complete len:83 (+) Transcript_45312:1305-1553(+)
MAYSPLSTLESKPVPSPDDNNALEMSRSVATTSTSGRSLTVESDDTVPPAAAAGVPASVTTDVLGRVSVLDQDRATCGPPQT